MSGAVEVVRTMAMDEIAEDGFSCLTLISKSLVRTILEGSTIVMKAINTSQEETLVKAISGSPRGNRLLEGMKELNVEPDIITYSTIIKGYNKSG